ncbi:hypothetical protein SAMN05660653_03081 [Desulfonatronum thiosulfatophilum]|uniref:Uncharacterized protein n=2 Tax=Desulfonatronum thiosulfatophilum TaxID=617002 RepID=A0A1G6ERL9_9BACT|nr:hypothetical protein SAMN05660653_03081 [Desulfonatronum thiosulfatophilum]
MEIIYVSPLNNEQELNALQSARELLPCGIETADSLEVWTCVEREGDIVILLHQGPVPEREGFSEQGLRIADIFSRFGWVSHTHWTKVAKETADKGQEPG